MSHWRLGNGAYMDQNWSIALSEFAQAEKLDPDLAQVNHSKGLTFWQMGRAAEAEAELLKAIQKDPKFSAAYNSLGKILMDLRREDEALAYLMRAAEDPLYDEAYKANTNLGVYFYRKGALDQAVAYFDTAVKMAPVQSCVAYFYRANTRLKQGKVSEALDDYDSATQKLCGGFVHAHYAKGIALQKAGRAHDAKIQFLEVKKLFPESKFARRAIERLKEIP